MECHRKIAARNFDRPAGRLLPGLAVDDRDRLRSRQVDEYLLAAGIELEAFRMGAQWNVGDLPERFGVDDRQSAIAISDEHLIIGGINPDVVGVIAQCDLSSR